MCPSLLHIFSCYHALLILIFLILPLNGTLGPGLPVLAPAPIISWFQSTPPSRPPLDVDILPFAVLLDPDLPCGHWNSDGMEFISELFNDKLKEFLYV